MKKDDIITQEYRCPNCSEILKEKFPKDKFLIKKLLTVRLFCVCGYYQDINIDSKDIKN